MTHCLYLEKNDLECQAIIKEIITAEGQPPAVILDQTLFHPQGGGQPTDLGTLNGIPVIKVTSNGSDVMHQLESISNLQVGDEVQITVDSDRRLLHSRYHTAGHLIAGVVEGSYPRVQAKQGHHWPGEARVEFTDCKEIDLEEILDHAKTSLKEDIKRDLPIAIDCSKNRLVKIVDYLPLSCGGTHVESLSELGEVKLEQIKRKRGMIRIRYSIAGHE